MNFMQRPQLTQIIEVFFHDHLQSFGRHLGNLQTVEKQRTFQTFLRPLLSALNTKSIHNSSTSSLWDESSWFTSPILTTDSPQIPLQPGARPSCEAAKWCPARCQEEAFLCSQLVGEGVSGQIRSWLEISSFNFDVMRISRFCLLLLSLLEIYYFVVFVVFWVHAWALTHLIV